MFTLFLKSTPPNNIYRPKHCHHTTVNNCQQSICLDSYDLHECKFRSNEFSGCCRLSTKQFPMSCHRGNHNDHDKSDHNLGGCWGRRGLNGSRFVVVCYQTFLNEAIPSRYREGIYQWWWGDTTMTQVALFRILKGLCLMKCSSETNASKNFCHSFFSVFHFVLLFPL